MSLSVRDVEVSELWYRRLFGLELLFEERDDDYDAVTLFDPKTSLLVGLIHHRKGATARFDETRIGLDHLALAVPDRAALREWEEHLLAEGVEHSGIFEVEHGAALTFFDPDHITLELFCFENPLLGPRGGP